MSPRLVRFFFRNKLLSVALSVVLLTPFYLRFFNKEFVEDGAVQLVIIPFVLLILSRLSIFAVRCPAILVWFGVLWWFGLLILPSLKVGISKIIPPAVAVARFNNDLVGATTSRFAEQLRFSLNRQSIDTAKHATFSTVVADSIDWKNEGVKTLVLRGDERRLLVKMAPHHPISLTDIANPSVAQILPPMKLWGGGVDFGLSIDKEGATAEFIALLVSGVSYSELSLDNFEREGAILSLVDAGKLVGKWRSIIHRAVPLLLASEQQLVRGLNGDRIQMPYIKCASKYLVRALALGDFGRDPILHAALKTDYGVVLWIQWLYLGDKRAKARAIKMWRDVVSMKQISENSREPSLHNLKSVFQKR